MTLGIILGVVAMLGIAIAVQVYYLRGLQRGGVEVNGATKVVSYVNITLLIIVAVGLLAFAFISYSAGRM